MTVAQVMEPDPENIDTVEQTSEYPRYHVGVPRTTVGHRKHETHLIPPARPHEELVFGLPRPPASKHRHGLGVQVEAATRSSRLDVADHRLVTDGRKRPANGQEPGVQSILASRWACHPSWGRRWHPYSGDNDDLPAARTTSTCGNSALMRL